MKQLCLLCLIVMLPFLSQADEGVLDRKISLPKEKGSVYEMLNLITREAGLFFIYNSHTLNNEKKARIPKGQYTVREAIAFVVADDGIKMKVVDKHILLYRDVNRPSVEKQPVTEVKPTFYTAGGTVRDKESKESVPYVSVSIPDLRVSTITNQDGRFILKLPIDSVNTQHFVTFSHLSYISQALDIELFSEGNTDIYLEPSITPLPEIIVGIVNPQKIVMEMMNRREQNYPNQPVYLTTFYREGVEQGAGGWLTLSEAVFKVYKTPFNGKSEGSAKLLKMRKVSGIREKDSVLLKIKAGISSSFLLDMVKNPPDFLLSDGAELYRYAKIGTTLTDSSLVHIIAFEQKKELAEPLYKGELYIDANNSALLKVCFQVNPAYVEKAEDLYVVRKSKKYDIKPQKIAYEVSYMPWSGKYYISHIRGDLTFKVKKKRQMFSSTSSVHSFFEMVTCKIDTVNVKAFPRRESLPSNSVFSDTRFVYDEVFWGDLNIILAEEELTNAIARLSVKIEEAQAP